MKFCIPVHYSIQVAVVLDPDDISPNTTNIVLLPEFVQFLETGMLKVIPFSTAELRDKTFVRLHYKAFDMGLSFVWDIDQPVGTEVLAMSHYEKIQKMKDWECNPFTSFRVLAVNKNKTVWRLHPKPVAITCSNCPKKGNAQCKFGLCKGCCLEKQQAESVSCKAHKAGAAAAAAAPAGVCIPVPQKHSRRSSKRAKIALESESDFDETSEEEEEFDEELLGSDDD